MKLGLEYIFIVKILAVAGIASCLYLLLKLIIAKNEVKLSFRNILRNKRRSFITLMAIAFALTGNILLGNYFLDLFYGLRESTIRSQTGHLQILKEGFITYGASAPGEYLIEDRDDILQALEDHEELSQLTDIVTSEIRFNGILTTIASEKSINYLARGIEPEKDRKMAAYDAYIDGGPVNKRHPYGVVLGEGLAEQLGVGHREEVTLLSTLFDGGINVLDGEIQGVLQPFSKEYGNVIVKTSLEFAQEMVGSDGVNKITILLDDTKDTLPAKGMLQEIVAAHPEWQVEVYDWQELVEFYSQVHTLFNNIYTIVNTLLFGLVIFLVVNTMTMNIYERFSEFGTLRSIGVKQFQLIDMVLLEGIMLGILGTIIGLGLAMGIGEIVSSLNILLPPPPGQSKPVSLNLVINLKVSGFLELAYLSITAIIGITAVAAFFPARKAAKLKIIDAIHTV